MNGIGSLVRGVLGVPGYIAHRSISSAVGLIDFVLIKFGIQNNNSKYASLVHLCNLSVIGIYLTLCLVPNYVTDPSGDSKSTLFNLDCKYNDSMDCSNRLRGVQAATIIAASLAFLNHGAIYHRKWDMVFWNSLYCFAATLTAFLLWTSFSTRPYWKEGAVSMNQVNWMDGLLFPLSMAGMAMSGLGFLSWIAFEVWHMPDGQGRIPGFALDITSIVAGVVGGQKELQEKIKDIRNGNYVKRTNEGAGLA